MSTLLWLACGACSGESMAILGVEGVGKGGDTLLDFLELYHVQLLWHPSLSLEAPKELAGLIERILAGRAGTDAPVHRGEHYPWPERYRAV